MFENWQHEKKFEGKDNEKPVGKREPQMWWIPRIPPRKAGDERYVQGNGCNYTLP
jgi:hypothetical protein